MKKIIFLVLVMVVHAFGYKTEIILEGEEVCKVFIDKKELILSKIPKEEVIEKKLSLVKDFNIATREVKQCLSPFVKKDEEHRKTNAIQNKQEEIDEEQKALDISYEKMNVDCSDLYYNAMEINPKTERYIHKADQLASKRNFLLIQYNSCVNQRIEAKIDKLLSRFK